MGKDKVGFEDIVSILLFFMILGITVVMLPLVLIIEYIYDKINRIGGIIERYKSW